MLFLALSVPTARKTPLSPRAVILNQREGRSPARSSFFFCRRGECELSLLSAAIAVALLRTCLDLPGRVFRGQYGNRRLIAAGVTCRRKSMSWPKLRTLHLSSFGSAIKMFRLPNCSQNRLPLPWPRLNAGLVKQQPRLSTRSG
jgi:hypothetical protein